MWLKCLSVKACAEKAIMEREMPAKALMTDVRMLATLFTIRLPQG
jgi:hypothetical protein